MESNITHRPSAVLTGVSIRTSNQRESGPKGQIPALWEEYFRSGFQERQDLINPHLLYALYTEYESDVNGEYRLLIGHEVDRDHNRENAAETAYIPEAAYIKFTTQRGPFGQVVLQLWQEIWDYFRTFELKRAYTGDFELYDMRGFDPQNAIVDIYVAIQENR